MVTAAQLVGRVAITDDDSARSKLQAVDKAVNATQAGLANKLVSATKSAGGGFLDFASKLSLVGMGAVGLVKGAGDLAGALLKPAMSAEQTNIAFTGLFDGNKAKAQDFLGTLRKFDEANSFFDWDNLTQSSRSMLAFGIEAKNVIPYMTRIGDTIATMGGGKDKVDAVVRAIGQMSAKTKVSAEEMMQLTEANIPAWDMLATSMGKSTAEVMDLASKGLIPADEGIQALMKGMERFAGGMERNSESSEGLFDRITTGANKAAIAFGKSIIESDSFKGALKGIADIAGSPAFQSFATGAGKAIVDVFTSIGNAVKSVDWGKFAGDFAYLGTQLGIAAPSGDQLKTAISGIGSILKMVVTDTGNFARGLGDVVKWFKDGSAPAILLGGALTGIGLAIAGIQIGALVATIPALVAGFLAWGAAAWVAAIGTIAATWPILAIGLLIGLVVAGIILAVKNWGAISKWLTDTWNAVATWFGWLFGRIGAWFGGIGQWFTDRFTEAKNGVMNAWGAIGQWFQDRKTQITNAFSNIGGWFRDKFNEAVNGIKSIFGGIGAWFQARWTDIKNAFPNLFDAGKNIVQSLINGLGAMIETVKKKAGDIAQGIRDFFPHSPAKLGPLVDIDNSMPIFGDMLAKGLLDQVGKLNKASFKVAAAIEPTLPNGLALDADSMSVSPNVSMPAGAMLTPRQPVINNYITVVPPNIEMDGRRLTNELLPHMKDAMQNRLGVRVV